MTEADFDRAYMILKEFLGAAPHTHTEILNAAKSVVKLLHVDGMSVEKLADKYEFNHGNVVVTPPTTLCKDENDGEWFDRKKRLLEGRKAEGYFDRYAAYLRREDIAEGVIEQLKLDAENTLRHCANPEGSLKEDQRKRRGLVVGDVQSGKTMNYLGLVNMACDYGYKVILILAGMTDSLRQQTQGRFDDGFIGAVSNTISTSDIKYVGVGIHPNGNQYHAVPLTNNDYDFLSFIRRTNNASVGDFAKPVVLVVKKHSQVLEQIAQWLLKPSNRHAESKSLLIIDDEADNASVNCRKPGYDPTAINRGIRDLFNSFEVASYIGFTATPFANIFINPDDDPSYHDLFPSDFITLLEPPSIYFGAKKVFSYIDDRNSKYLRLLDEEEENFFPVRHKKGEFHFEKMPRSMKEAVLCFLLGCSIRTARGAVTKHRSMMINISVVNDVQFEIYDVVSKYVEELRDQISQTIALSESEFLKCEDLKWLKEIYLGKGEYAGDKDYFCEPRKDLPWKAIKANLLDEIAKFEVAVINNKKRGPDRFSYEARKGKGARVIAIGGYVLSRGLTLEGLMISYFSRNASAYDSLLQMCRWFGYRPGYEDTCRIYISPHNVMNFRAVIGAVEDLKTQFREMKLCDAKPETFGLMVKESPDSLETRLLITSRNKMQSTNQKVFQLNYGGVAADTSKLSDDEDEIEKNKNAVDELSADAKRAGIQWEDVKCPTGKSKRHMLRNVPKMIVAKMLSGLAIPSDNTKFDAKSLSEYVKRSEIFTTWDVVISSGDSENMFYGQKQNIRSFRKRVGEPIRIGDTNNRLINPGIFESGLTQEQMLEVKKNAESRVAANGKGDPAQYVSSDYLKIRDRNPILAIYPIELRAVKGEPPATDEEKRVVDLVKKRGGIVGFGIGFPAITSNERVVYRLNKIKQREMEKTQEPEEDNEFDEA